MVIATLWSVLDDCFSSCTVEVFFLGVGGDFEEGVEVGGVIVEVLGGRTGMQRSV